MKTLIKEYIQECIETKNKISNDDGIINNISTAADLIINTFKNGGTVFTAGNGGSAADAQHIAGEFVSKFAIERRGLPAIALTTDSSILTAVSNDLGYENIFVRQIQTLAKQGDVFIAISTSGTSPNIVNAVNTAKSSNIYTIGLTGKTAAPIDKICDCIIKVPSDNVPVIQECHIMIEHIICDIVEKVIFNS